MHLRIFFKFLTTSFILELNWNKCVIGHTVLGPPSDYLWKGIAIFCLQFERLEFSASFRFWNLSFLVLMLVSSRSCWLLSRRTFKQFRSFRSVVFLLLLNSCFNFCSFLCHREWKTGKTYLQVPRHQQILKISNLDTSIFSIILAWRRVPWK